MCWPERQEMQKVIVSLVHSIHVLSLLAKGKDWEAHFPSWDGGSRAENKTRCFPKLCRPPKLCHLCKPESCVSTSVTVVFSGFSREIFCPFDFCQVLTS